MGYFINPRKNELCITTALRDIHICNLLTKEKRSYKNALKVDITPTQFFNVLTSQFHAIENEIHALHNNGSRGYHQVLNYNFPENSYRATIFNLRNNAGDPWLTNGATHSLYIPKFNKLMVIGAGQRKDQILMLDWNQSDETWKFCGNMNIPTGK